MINSEPPYKVEKGGVLNIGKVFDEVNKFETSNDIGIFLAVIG
jgi:hypothetical protein